MKHQVRVANLGRNSRYYSGSGIYRHTWLTVVDAVHVPLWGASVATPEVAVTSVDRASSALVTAVRWHLVAVLVLEHSQVQRRPRCSAGC